ncbi:MAG: penicillin-binding transpeptidase domain-containing protein, partial [Bdellovibrionales bacterium]
QEALKVDTLTKGSYVIRTTVHPGLQRVAEESLQNHLAAYEERTKGPRREPRVKFTGPQGSLADDLDTYNNSWQEALANAEPKLHDVRWPLAVVLQPYGASVKTKGGKTEKSTTVKVGLSDGRNGRIIPLTGLDPKIAQQLKLYDLIFVQVDETKKPVTAKLKVPPQVQGAVVVLEAKTGRVLAMTGGFSYVASNFNRATRAERQPGSTLKPFIYLAALNMGFRPDTLIPNLPIDLDPVDRRSRKKWRPHNYDYDVGGNVTLRTAIERSMNLPTVRMMSHLGPTHPQGLQTVCRTAEKLGIYSEGMDCVDYSTALGAKETHLLSMAVAYATVANDGLMPVPHFIESIEERGQEIYQRPRFGLEPVPSINRVSFYQLRRILEGTVSERGTASRIQNLKGYVAGKTGTTDNYHDAWFVGFTKDLVVAVWVGYDNDKIYSSLGPGRTGAQVALPIAESILRSSFEVYRQKEFLPDAPDEIRHLIREEPLENNRAGLRPGDLRNVFRLHNEFPPDILLNGYERNLPILYDPNGDEPDEEAATEEESSPTHAREDDPNASGGTYEYAEGSAGEPVSRPPQFRSDESGSLTASPFPGPYMQGPYPGDGASVAPMNSPREDAAFGPLRF